jgi:hypothetical protein
MNNNQIKPVRCFLKPSKNLKVENLKFKVRENYKIPFYKTDVVAIAIAELLNNVATDKQLENLLEKYNYV